MPPCVKNLITVYQLINRCAPPSEYHRGVWSRRARLWSVSGILPTAIPLEGNQKRRLYSQNIVFLAGVLFRISDLEISTDFLSELAFILYEAEKGRTNFGRMWRRVKQGKSSHQAYISASHPRDTPFISVSLSESGIAELDLADDDAPAVVLNLTKVFEELSAAAAEEGS